MLELQLTHFLSHEFLIYVMISYFIYMSWVQLTPSVTLNNVTPPNKLLYNSYFENLTIKLYVLYVFNIHANFHVK